MTRGIYELPVIPIPLGSSLGIRLRSGEPLVVPGSLVMVIHPWQYDWLVEIYSPPKDSGWYLVVSQDYKLRELHFTWRPDDRDQ